MNTSCLSLTVANIPRKNELWENFTSFIEEVALVAEEEGMRIGIHPDDPTCVEELAGIPRCIFGNHAGYTCAMEIANRPNVGIYFCVGCWLEGGELMGKGTLESIQDFGRQNKIFKVRFCNVDPPLPHFVETFIDNGYMDMFKVMKALREVEFDGVVIPNHIPMMGDDPRIGTAYSFAYMKAMLDRANAEAS